jgi:hypothetical protein
MRKDSRALPQLAAFLYAVAFLLFTTPTQAQQTLQALHDHVVPADSAGQTTDVPGDAEAAARADWRASIAHNTPLSEGCFQASYPNMVWEQVECKEGHPRSHTIRKFANGEQVAGNNVGNGYDYVAESAGLISETVGFLAVTGVTSEETVGGGIDGPNEYELQLNTNATGTTSACAGHTGCTVWQQYLYATDYLSAGEADVYIEYWLLGWGSSACPSGWNTFGTDCWKNSAYTTAPDMPISNLGSQSFSGTAVSGGNDTVTFNNGTTAYALVASDSVLDISSVWNESEFNVFGDTSAAEAVFNPGSSITVNVALTDGSTAAPACVINGTTGETNNLTLGPCTTAGGTPPSIQFDEGNQPPTITSQDDTTFLVGIFGSFQVIAVSDPPSTFTASGTLPFPVNLSPSGLLSGTPASGTGGVYTFDITATNGVAPYTTQTFTLTVDQAPIITSANHTTFTAGKPGSFQVTAIGFPAPTLTTPGPLPPGVTLSASGLLSGIPTAGGTYKFIITASNGVAPNATQLFTLTVDKAATTCSLAVSSVIFSNGQPTIFTAFVHAGAGEVDSPTGTVTFIDEAFYEDPLGAEPVIDGVADLSYVLQAPPDRQFIKAVYSGDGSFKGCTSPIQTMNYLP